MGLFLHFFPHNAYTYSIYIVSRSTVDLFFRCKKNTWASYAKIITLSQYKTIMEIDEKTQKESSDDKSSTGGSNDVDVEPNRNEL